MKCLTLGAAYLALQPEGNAGQLDLLSRGVMGKTGKMLWSLGAAEGCRRTDGQIFL